MCDLVSNLSSAEASIERKREKERERQTDRQTETETDRDRQRQRDRERDKETERQRERQRETETDRERQRDRETERDRDREKRTHGGSWEDGRTFHLPRDPRALTILFPSPLNIFIALACYPSPLDETKGTSAEERVSGAYVVIKFSVNLGLWCLLII